MTVSNTTSVVQRVGNGVTVNWPTGFRFFKNTDLVVTKRSVAGITTLLTLNTDYSVTGANALQGGTVTTTNPLAVNELLTIARVLTVQQLTDLRNQGDYFAEIHEDVFDYLTMLIQQTGESDSRALRHPRDSEHYQAEARRIVDLEDPVDAQDAATKNWAQQFIASILATGQGPINNAANIVYLGPDNSLHNLQELSGDSGAALIGVKGPGTGEVRNTVSRLLLDTISTRRFGAKHDGVTDDTAAINAAILHIAVTLGGGKLVFPAGVVTKVLGKILVPSNVEIDGSWSEIVGAGSTVGTFFESAYVSGSTIVTNIGTPIESHIVTNSTIHHFRCRDVGQIFNFYNFTIGAGIHDIKHSNVRQFGKFERCFYPLLFNISGSGGSDASIPCFHFKDQSNALKFLNVQTTMEYGLFVESGGAVIDLDNWRFEGGSKGAKLAGEVHAFSWHGCYFEAVPGTMFDFSACTFITFFACANYYNYVDIVLFDGASQTAGPVIYGSFDETNEIVNVGGTSNGVTYRGRMEINGIRNFAKYRLQDDAQAVLSMPANWITGLNTQIERVVAWTGNSVSDFRQKSRFMGSAIIPLFHGGDVGQAYTGSVPFCTVTSSGASVFVDTKIVWRPDSMFVDFTFTAQDGNGVAQVFGRLYGANVDKRHTGPITVTASNNGGFLRLTLGVTAPFLQVTGTVKIAM